MKKHFKKATVFFLALLIVTTSFSAFSFSVSATKTEETFSTKRGTTGDCTWELDEDGTLTISGEGSIDTSPWDYWKDTIKIVNIKTGVTSIGNYVFFECNSLKSIIIPNSVTSIGDSAIVNCASITSITVDERNLKYDSRNNCNAIIETGTNTLFLGCTNTVIPNSVECIGDFAFYECTSLTSITIPESVTCIGYCAFLGCTSLTSITIPESVTSIDYFAFKKCISLTSITIPNSVTSIGYNVFSECTSLTSITVDERNPIYDSRNNCNAIIETETETLIRGCANTVIPNGVECIGEEAFFGCTSLMSITLPKSVTSIDYCAFEDCTNLTSITIPDSVTNIGNCAFANCRSLTSITVNKRNSIYDSRNNCNAIIETASNTLIQGCNNAVIPNSVTSIDNWAFYGCISLTSIKIPESVTNIGDYAFSECTSLTSITIPESVICIDYGAFYRCTSLTSITIPKSVTNIGGCAFEECTSLTSITVDERNPIYDSRNKCNAIIETETETLIQGCANTVIPNNVISIDDHAFARCTSLMSITIPNSVTNIGDYAFYGCTSLTSITIPESVTGIGNSAFENCISLTSITIPDSVTSIGNYTFYGCTNLEVITIPYKLTDIGYQAFRGTKWLGDQSEGVVYAGSAACDYKVGASAPEQKEITLKPDTKSITQGAFFGCNIESIIIPNTVTKIGSYSFANCQSLKSVTIPSSVKSIGEKAFGYYSENAKIEEFLIFDDMNFEIYKFADNKGIDIQGTKNSAAENYATENKFTFTESDVYDYKFSWGTDNWGFDNVKESVQGASIDEETVEKLAKIFHIENNQSLDELKKKLEKISNDNWDFWYGSCFGMTVAEILVKQGLLSLSDYGVGNISNALPTDKNKLITLISVLSELQNCECYKTARKSRALSTENSSSTTDEGSQNSDTTSITQKSFIEKIEEELKTFENEEEAKKNHSVILIEYEFKDSKNITKCHAVLGYGIESGNYDINGKTYDHRILIADPNYLSQNCLYKDACIYYNSSNGHWICPYLKKCYWNGNEQDPGGIYRLIKYNSLTDPEFYPEVSKDYYIAGLTIFNANGNQSVGKGITEYNIVDQPDDRKFYALDNNTKDCSFSYNEPSDYSMMMDYEDISYFADVKNGTSTSVNPEGYINIKGSEAKYSLTMMTDNPKYESDWYSITVSGNNTNSVTLTKQEDGYFLETDTPGNVTITAKSDSGKTTGVYKISGGSAIIKKNGDNIIVEIQSNGGEDPNIELTPIMIGDVDYNGSIDVSDVTKIQKHLAHLPVETELNNYLADTNGDEQVDINDATQIQKYLLKLVAALGKA